LNVNKNKLIKELFRGDEKATLEELRTAVKHYDDA
jgi:hypothetical protein